MRIGRARRRGFTLIEALAAFAILALSLGQLLRSIRAGAENERRADFLMRATTDGQSHLAALGAAVPLVAGETTGRYEDGLVWTLSVARDRAISSVAGAPLVIAYRVRLEVRLATAPGQALDFVAERLSYLQPLGGAP
jgi:type II secretory pathway pseudopilin PulG